MGRILRSVASVACLACSAPREATPTDKPHAAVQHYAGTTIAISPDEAKAASGDPAAIRDLLNAVCHADGQVSQYLCLYPFPMTLRHQAQRVVEQAPHVCPDITRRLIDCVHFSYDTWSAPLAATVRQLKPATDAEARIQTALVDALEHPNPDWP